MDGCWMDGMPGPIDDTTPTPSICFCEAARCRIRSSPCRLPRELSSACLPACLSVCLSGFLPGKQPQRDWRQDEPGDGRLYIPTGSGARWASSSSPGAAACMPVCMHM